LAYQVFETTIFNRVLGAEAQMLFVPEEVMREVEPAVPAADSLVGVRLGVRVPDPESLVDVLYASAQGRPTTFDPGSFGRWRPRWQGELSEESAFSQELVFGDRVPVSESPLRTESMEHLIARGEAWVANGADWAWVHPLHALGVVILVDGAVLVVALRRAVRETVVIAAKYHLRRVLGVPSDWLPPEDRL
jgi:hypothetical protein